MGLRAKTARVIRKGITVDVPINEVVHGDLILVRPGEKIHEQLLTGAECERAYLRNGLFVIAPLGTTRPDGQEAPAEELFKSETGPYLTRKELRALVREGFARQLDEAAFTGTRECEQAGAW